MYKLILKDDMGSSNSLKITREDDGDIIVSIITEGDRINNAPEVQFCVSGTANHGVASFFNLFIKQFSGESESEFREQYKPIEYKPEKIGGRGILDCPKIT